MGWSRNLGTVDVGSLEGVLQEATTTSTPDMATKTFVTEQHLSPEEQDLRARALAVAKLGVEKMGGKADVHIGGGHTVMADGSVQRSISVTVTVTTPPAPSMTPRG